MTTMMARTTNDLLAQDGREEWTETQALAPAAEEGLTLTPAHWEVIHSLRESLEANGFSCLSRHVP